MPLTRYSSTSSTPSGRRDGDQRGALARLDRAELVAESERLGADAAWRSRRIARGRHVRARGAASPPARRTGSGRRRWPGCRCRSRRARPRRRSASTGGLPAPDPAVAARAGHERRAAPRPAARAPRRCSCTPCTASSARVEQPEPIEVLHRPARRAASSAGFQAPSASSSVAPRPAAVAQELDLLRRLAEMDAADGVRHRARAIAANSAGETEYGACGTTSTRDSQAIGQRRDRSAAAASTSAARHRPR